MAAAGHNVDDDEEEAEDWDLEFSKDGLESVLEPVTDSLQSTPRCPKQRRTLRNCFVEEAARESMTRCPCRAATRS